MSVKVTATFKPNQSWWSKFNTAKITALEKTGEALRGDLIQSQTMPFDTGHLQNESTFVDYGSAVEGLIRLISSTPYARKLYFNPQFNFRRDKNPNAGGRWLDPYLPGHARADFIPNAYARFLKKELTGGT